MRFVTGRALRRAVTATVWVATALVMTVIDVHPVHAQSCEVLEDLVVDGFLGLGTTSPTTILDASGTIRATWCTTPSTGSGVEIRFYSDPIGVISAQERPSGTVLPLKIYGDSLLLNPDTGGKVGIGTYNPTAQLEISGSRIGIRTAFTPSGTGDSTGAVGDIAWDNSYVYVKTSSGWKRAVLQTF